MIETLEIRFPGQGGDEIGGFLARPGTPLGEGRPGIVLLHAVFGLDVQLRGVAERFAREGFVVLAPDLYSREGLPGPASRPEDPAPAWSPEAIRAAVAGLPDRRVRGDVEGALVRLAAEEGVDPGRLAAVGFCMGGAFAFLAGCTSERLGAVVSFYGRIVYPELSAEKPVQPLELALNLSAPFLGLYGAEDSSIPLAHVERLREVLTQFARPFEVVTYAGAGHGFCDELRGGYRQDAARDAWQRALAFLRESLE